MIEAIGPNLQSAQPVQAVAVGKAATQDAQPAAESQSAPMATAPKIQAEQAQAVTVELSTEAQAKLLKDQGLSIPLIAAQLGIDEATVSAYFSLSA
jgi:DNA-binding NarL/FixJ family response regulator